jgi:hypothetical protein
MVSRVLGTTATTAVAVFLFFYPAIFTLRVARDPAVHSSGQPATFPEWFKRTSHRSGRWGGTVPGIPAGDSRCLG